MGKTHLGFAIALLSACGGAQPAATPASPPQTTAPLGSSSAGAPAVAAPSPASSDGELLSAAESVDFCVRLHEQMVPCAPEFIDLTMDLRAKYFPEFAQKIATPESRASAKKIGIDEVMADGAGPLEPRRKRCQEYVEHGPPTPRSAPLQMEPCFAKQACGEKIECMRPVMEARFQARKAGEK